MIKLVGISNIVIFCEGFFYRQNFPIHFILINQTKTSNNFKSRQLKNVHISISKVDDINGIVITEASSLFVFQLWIFPGLRNHSIIKHWLKSIMSQNFFPKFFVQFHVLNNWVKLSSSLYFHFRCRVSLNFY